MLTDNSFLNEFLTIFNATFEIKRHGQSNLYT